MTIPSRDRRLTRRSARIVVWNSRAPLFVLTLLGLCTAIGALAGSWLVGLTVGLALALVAQVV